MNIAELVVSIVVDDSDLNKGIDNALSKAKASSGKFGGFAKGLGGELNGILSNALSFAGGQMITNFLGILDKGREKLEEISEESIKIASNLQEVQNVVDVTFGDNKGQIEIWSQNARKQFGLTELQAKEFSSTMGAMLKSMQLDDSRIYDMSTALAGLAADMASFYNLDFDTAFQKIRAGISGETEPLKQLGINMSVANLEAFALQQGIKKTYESMSQAEQATLRYNYLMQATADAQGDFARTSDSYANAMRYQETLIDSLTSKLGELLLPLRELKVNFANGILEMLLPEDSGLVVELTKAKFNALSESFEDSEAAIRKQAFTASYLVDELVALGDYSQLTADKQKEWQAIAGKLTEVMPQLSSEIDTQNGKFKEGEQAIRDHIAALRDEAHAQALQKSIQGTMDALAEAEMSYYQKEADYKAAYGEWINAKNKVTESAIAFQNEYKMTVAEAEKNLSNALYSGWFGHSKKEVEAAVEAHKTLEIAQADTSATAANLGVEFEAEAESLGVAQAATEKAIKAYEDAGKAAGFLVDAEGNLVDANGNVVVSQENVSTTVEDAKEHFTSLSEEAKKVSQMFDDLSKYRLDNFNQVKSQIEGVYGTFDKADRVRKTSARNMEKGIQSQIDQLDRYDTARKQLEEMGASEDFLANFDYSTESIAQMEAIAKGGEDALTTLEEKDKELKAKQEEIAKAISDTKLSVDDDFQTMTKTAEDAQKAFLEKTKGIQESAGKMLTDVLAKTLGAGLSILGIQTQGDALGDSEWEPTIEADDQASRVIETVSNLLNTLNGKKAVVDIVARRSGGGEDGSEDGTPHATGLDYVPYDDYLARLHKGESVLTAAEADNWRNGARDSSRQSDLPPIVININADGWEDKTYELERAVANGLERARWRA